MMKAVRVEWWKLRRSRVALVATTLMCVLLPALGLAFYSVALNGGTGSLADKAAALMIGEGWTGYLGLVDQVAAAAVFLGAGVVVAWVFGREHVDRTFPSLFALPVSRGAIAGAKFVVLGGWVLFLAAVICLVALTLGVAGGIGPFEVDVVVSGLLRLLAICIGAGLLSLTMGFVASVGRGYLPAIGALIVLVAAAQVSVLFGTGGWFPFAVPGLMAVAGAEGVPDLNAIHLTLVPALGAAGVGATVWWWRKAEVV